MTRTSTVARGARALSLVAAACGDDDDDDRRGHRPPPSPARRPPRRGTPRTTTAGDDDRHRRTTRRPTPAPSGTATGEPCRPRHQRRRLGRSSASPPRARATTAPTTRRSSTASTTFSEDNGYEDPIIVDNIDPAEAETELRNLARQNVDMIAVGAGEIADPLADARRGVRRDLLVLQLRRRAAADSPT